MYNSGRGSSSQSDYYNRYPTEKSYSRTDDSANGGDDKNNRRARRKNRWDNPDGSGTEYKRLTKERSRSPVSRNSIRKDNNTDGLNPPITNSKAPNNWSDSSSDDERGRRDYRHSSKEVSSSSYSRSENNNNGSTGSYAQTKLLDSSGSRVEFLASLDNPALKSGELKNSGKIGLKLGSELIPQPPVKSLSSTGIQIKLLPQMKPMPNTVTPIKSKSFKVASVFNLDDDDEEEMPAECKMRMKNVGRETVTSSGPNSFGKTKIGFCNVNQIKERKLQEELQKKVEKK